MAFVLPFVAGLELGGGLFGTKSKNTLAETVNATNNLSITVNNNCMQSVSSDQITITSGNTAKGDININNDQEQYVTVDMKCLASSQAVTQIQQAITSNIQQYAQAVSQALNFNPGETASSNATNVTYNVMNTTVTTLTNTCAQQIDTYSAAIATNNTSGATINIWNNQKSYIDAMNQCVFDNLADTTAIQQFETDVAQKSIAKEESIFGGITAIIVALIIVAGIVLFIFFGPTPGGDQNITPGMQRLKTTRTVVITSIVIIVIVVGTLLLCYFMKWWPFNTDTSDSSSKNTKQDRRPLTTSF